MGSLEPERPLGSRIFDEALSSRVPKGLIWSRERPCWAWLDSANTAIEEKDIGRTPMECPVEVPRSGHSRSLAIVEEPDSAGRSGNGFQAHSAGFPSAAVDEAVQGKVEEQMTVATSRVGRTEPELVAQWSERIGPPRSLVVVRGDSYHRRQVGVPSVVGGNTVGRSIGGQPTARIYLVQMRGDAPLLEVGEAVTGASGIPSAGQSWQQQQRKDPDHT